MNKDILVPLPNTAIKKYIHTFSSTDYQNAQRTPNAKGCVKYPF